MERQIFLGTCAALLLGFGADLNFQRSQADRQASDLTLADLESMAIPPDEWDMQPPVGNRIICKCDKWYEPGTGCRVNYDGAKCAQSEEGGNISCANYDSNCN